MVWTGHNWSILTGGEILRDSLLPGDKLFKDDFKQLHLVNLEPLGNKRGRSPGVTLSTVNILQQFVM